MGNLYDAPYGETGNGESQNGRGIGKIPKSSGWRKPTPDLGIAEQFAQAGEQESIPKSQALLAIKRVAAHTGLKASDIMLLDTFGAFTKPQDWEQGRRPLIWASNAYLMEQTGFSLSALKRHARRLVEAGVIAFKDSPNGKRWGHRDEDGYIVEAYGFDLAPLAARAEEFEHLFEELQAERELCKRAKRQITIARRMIRAKIDTALTQMQSGPWDNLHSAFAALLEQLPGRNVSSERLLALLKHFRAFLERVEQAFGRGQDLRDEVVDNACIDDAQSMQNTEELDPKGAINEPHILVTNKLNPVISNSLEIRKAAGTSPETSQVEQSDRDAEGWSTKRTRSHHAALEVEIVMQACPEFAKFARGLGGYIKNWNELHRVAGQIRPMVGVSEHAWNIAQEQLGSHGAAAALALIFDKYSAGDVSSPGGYLRGLVEKARAGELYLERSFYGRLGGQQAA